MPIWNMIQDVSYGSFVDKYKLIHGECIAELKKLPDQSVDSVCTDPPYPHIVREYGIWTEDEWNAMMDLVIVELRRVLKPSGSAMFVLQANHETPGKVRPWLWDFLSKYTKEWGMVQDVYAWNYTCMPTTHCSRKYGLMRPSVKMLCWFGPPDCFKNQDAILWEQADANKAHKLSNRALKKYPSGSSMREGRCIATANERGGSTPFNLIPVSSGNGKKAGSSHGAATPMGICEWMVNYITPKDGVVLDPFSGSATIGVAALKHRFQYIGIERKDDYFAEASVRLAETSASMESIL